MRRMLILTPPARRKRLVMRHPQTWKLAVGTTAGSSRILRARHERPGYCRDIPKGEARRWPARVLP